MAEDNTAAVGQWDLVQMGFAVITCCAPIYKSLLPKTSLFSTAKSRYALLAYGLRHGSGSGSRKTGTEISASENSHRDGDWIPLDGSNEGRCFITTQINSQPKEGNDNVDGEHPLKIVQIQQSVETV